MNGKTTPNYIIIGLEEDKFFKYKILEEDKFNNLSDKEDGIYKVTGGALGDKYYQVISGKEPIELVLTPEGEKNLKLPKKPSFGSTINFKDTKEYFTFDNKQYPYKRDFKGDPKIRYLIIRLLHKKLKKI